MSARQGAKHHAAKMNAAKVRQARKTYDLGKTTIRALADKYGIAHQTMWAIVHRKTWTHIS